MKKVASWIITFVVFVVIRIILGEVGVYGPRDRVGGFLDCFIFLSILGIVQFAFNILKDKNGSDSNK